MWVGEQKKGIGVLKNKETNKQPAKHGASKKASGTGLNIKDGTYA